MYVRGSSTMFEIDMLLTVLAGGDLLDLFVGKGDRF